MTVTIPFSLSTPAISSNFDQQHGDFPAGHFRKSKSTQEDVSDAETKMTLGRLIRHQSFAANQVSIDSAGQPTAVDAQLSSAATSSSLPFDHVIK